MSNYWISEQEQLARERWLRELNKSLENALWGIPQKREEKEDDNVKLAWVKIKGYRTMLGVDNKTLKGYLLNDSPTWKTPLESIDYDEFESWCTTFDV